MKLPDSPEVENYNTRRWRPSRALIACALGAWLVLSLTASPATIQQVRDKTGADRLVSMFSTFSRPAIEIHADFPKGITVDNIPAIWQAAKEAPLLQEPVYNSQMGEDAYLEHYFFPNQTHGTYLEIGGLDGLTYSNTYHFEQNAGWRGILIEADPTNYAKLKENRPRDLRINAAVCKDEKTLTLVRGRDGATAGVLEFMTDQVFLDEWFPEIQTKDVEYYTVGHVPCVPMRDIIAYSGLSHINFFSLDVEGAELQVLESIDFTRVRFDVIVTEILLANDSRSEQMRAILTKNGYVAFDRPPPQALLDRWGAIKDHTLLGWDSWYHHKSFVLPAVQ